MVHFGMHGTVEWLPGSPLGNTGLSWSDVLLGPLPNIYLYAANNPSESIIAKRRGYGCIVSHNVPPYGRAGKDLSRCLLTACRKCYERFLSCSISCLSTTLAEKLDLTRVFVTQWLFMHL